MKGLRDALKREKWKDEKAMADAEKKRNKVKEAMRHLEQRAQMREHLRSHRMPTDAPPERKKAMRMGKTTCDLPVALGNMSLCLPTSVPT